MFPAPLRTSPLSRRALLRPLPRRSVQQVKRIQPFTMPLMSLAATALDQPKPREDVIATMLQYLPTDSVICREEPGPVADRQAQVGQAGRQAGSGQ